ncbi:MAG: class II aldolase/adducin family protein [Candidatus Wallbacteria bacterium]|nr:class II aldolase/adducin family protein [Candidatus Wallbacteria bacterium]
MLQSRYLHAIRAASAALFACGFGNAHRTWLSLRDGSAMCTTRDEALLSEASWEDLVQSAVFRKAGPEDRLAAALPLHRTLFALTSHRALIQTTPPGALALTIGAADAVGLLANPPVPLVEPAPDTPADRFAERVARALRKGPLVLVRATAVLAAGQDLESAARLVCELEARARQWTTPRKATCG